MAGHLKPGTAVGAYRIRQFIGQGEHCTLYLASRDEALVWLVEAETMLAHLSAGLPRVDVFNAGEKHYMAFPVEGTSVVTLLQLVDALEPAFVGWRWIELARDVGYLHKLGVVYQRNHHFSLDQVLFNHQANLFPLSERSTANDSMIFPAPEAASGPITPASDVYALGASMQAALGAGVGGAQGGNAARLSSGLRGVLQKATARDPGKRYKDANAFGLALADVLPAQPQTKRADEQSRSPILATAIVLLLLLLIGGAAAIGLGLWSPLSLIAAMLPAGPTPVPTSANVPDADISTMKLAVQQVQIAPPCTLAVKYQLAPEAPLPQGALVTSALWANNQPLPEVVRESATGDAPDVYRLRAAAPDFCASGGLLRVGARVGNALGTSNLFYTPPVKNDAKSNLDKVTIASIQVDTQHYPTIDLYLGVADKDQRAVAVQGPFQVDVLQDDKQVANFEMSRVETGALPMTAILAMDVSGSMQGPPLAKARQAAEAFVNALGPNDSICLYSFATQVRRVVPCTKDKATVLRGIAGLQAKDNTALYDLLDTVATDHATILGRQAVILLSDGGDTVSRLKLPQALERVRTANIPIYAIGLMSAEFNGGALQDIASASGGTFLKAPSADELAALYERVQGQLQNPYRIRFRSIAPTQSHGMIQIQFRDGDTSVRGSREFVVSQPGTQ